MITLNLVKVGLIGIIITAIIFACCWIYGRFFMPKYESLGHMLVLGYILLPTGIVWWLSWITFLIGLIVHFIKTSGKT